MQGWGSNFALYFGCDRCAHYFVAEGFEGEITSHYVDVIGMYTSFAHWWVKMLHMIVELSWPVKSTQKGLDFETSEGFLTLQKLLCYFDVPSNT
jgi:hypothetical protein